MEHLYPTHVNSTNDDQTNAFRHSKNLHQVFLMWNFDPALFLLAENGYMHI
jgi:hypothetical protein